MKVRLSLFQRSEPGAAETGAAGKVLKKEAKLPNPPVDAGASEAPPVSIPTPPARRSVLGLIVGRFKTPVVAALAGVAMGTAAYAQQGAPINNNGNVRIGPYTNAIVAPAGIVLSDGTLRPADGTAPLPPFLRHSTFVIPEYKIGVDAGIPPPDGEKIAVKQEPGIYAALYSTLENPGDGVPLGGMTGQYIWSKANQLQQVQANFDINADRFLNGFGYLEHQWWDTKGNKTFRGQFIGTVSANGGTTTGTAAAIANWRDAGKTDRTLLFEASQNDTDHLARGKVYGAAAWLKDNKYRAELNGTVIADSQKVVGNGGVALAYVPDPHHRLEVRANVGVEGKNTTKNISAALTQAGTLNSTSLSVNYSDNGSGAAGSRKIGAQIDRRIQFMNKDKQISGGASVFAGADMDADTGKVDARVGVVFRLRW